MRVPPLSPASVLAMQEADISANAGKKPSEITTFSDPNVISVSVPPPMFLCWFRPHSFVVFPFQLSERRTLNCLVKQYLKAAGYKLTAVTLSEEVLDQVGLNRGLFVLVLRQCPLQHPHPLPRVLFRTWMTSPLWACTCATLPWWACTASASRRYVQATAF